MKLDAPSVLMQATDDGTQVALWWERYPDAAGYNLYRSTDHPATRPLNGERPIAPVSTCAELKHAVPPTSREWGTLVDGFTAFARAADPVAAEVDPCEAVERGLTSEEDSLFDTLGESSLSLRVARGLAYIDRRVQLDATYVYELRGVLADGGEVVLAVDVRLWIGHTPPPDPPSGLSLLAGDHRVLALWNRNPYAHSFAVQRSTSPGGPFLDVNPRPVRFDVDRDFNDQPVSPPRPGFLDSQHWTPEGSPDGHAVGGVTVTGPDNGAMYHYRVASADLLGRVGGWSAQVTATPRRGTPPMAPDAVQVAPRLSPSGLVVSWCKVTRDADGHQLPDVAQTYAIYRAERREDLEDIAGLPGREVGSLVADPQDPLTPTLSWTDLDPVPAFGETTFFYRVRCTDPYANTGAPSAVIGGYVPDTTAPGRTILDGGFASDTFLRVDFTPNSEPDLAGYQVYRSVCDRGQLYVPKENDRPRGKCDMTLVGQVTRVDADAMWGANGRISFEDHSVPDGSPLCYGYWVRAFDLAGNLYDGRGGCPELRSDYICLRLIEKVPPPAPVLTGLQARNEAVLVQWVASPVQDLRAFHVYRSGKEFDPPTFLACVLTDGTISGAPWTGLAPACTDIPAEPDPLAAHGEFLDTTAVPQQVYWYRVSAIDWLGNESEGSGLERLPSSSTFTYTSDLPATPAVAAPSVPIAAGCGLDIAWGPAFDPAVLEGFVVYRAATGGPYRQVSPILTGNVFTDPSARRAVDYWYRVQAVDTSGRLSPPSAPVLHRY